MVKNFVTYWCALMLCSYQPALSRPNFSSIDANYKPQEMLVLDDQNKIEWLRCSLGQVWHKNTCTGSVLSLNHEQIAQAIEQANDQIGGSWRLPSLAELESLVCEECGVPKIDQAIFPNTSPEPYWTGDRRDYKYFGVAPFFSVNFHTGHTYGRFFPDQNLAVRLVRDVGDGAN